MTIDISSKRTHPTEPSMRLLRQLDPRLHIAAAIGWSVFVVISAAALVAASLAASEAEDRARADAEALLSEFATQVRDALSMNLETHRSVLLSAAAQLSAASDQGLPATVRTLLAVQEQFPEFTWLGAVDEHGRVVAATAAGRLGNDVGSTAWFRSGRVRPFVGDVQPLSATDSRSPGTIDIAVPLDLEPGGDSGVVAAAVSWSWVLKVLSDMEDALSQHRRVEVLLVARDGTVLYGPSQWLGTKLMTAGDVGEGKAYVVGSRAQLRLAGWLGLGWTAIVRQDADTALAPVRTTRRTVFAIVFFAGLLSAAAAAMVTRVLTRRLSMLAIDAESVRRGEHRALSPPPGIDEVSRIGATLAEVVDHLQTEKQALQTLNSELDRRVAERTARIERMADEARHAAVTRERLRIARDLHDTLAHSLMALLTQIRLVRKLSPRMGAAELDGELGRAESVATDGLAGARSAISQMRDNGVQDAGLGPSLQDLARRFGQRTGIAVAFEADPLPGAWADDRAETVFRIVEEALRNVERHANSKAVRIRLASEDWPAAPSTESILANEGATSVEVVDDGVGFEVQKVQLQPGHYGLIGMAEQAALIGSRFSVVSAPGRGTRVVLRIDR